MNKMKKLLGIILSLSLVLGMIMPSMNTKAEGTEQIDISLVKSFEVVATKTLREGDTMLAPVPEGQESYYFYDPSKTEPRIIVTFTDDSVKAYSNDELRNTFGEGCGFSLNQSATNVWGIGKHTATAHFAGKTCDFEVEVVENPVKSIEGIYHGILVEGTQVEYDTWDVEFIFTFSDGSKESYSYYDSVLGEQIAPMLTPVDLGAEGAWDAGEHYWTGKMYGREFQVKVDVLSLDETPIKSISAVATKDLVADWHAVGMPGAEYLGVDACLPKVEITYQDGTKESVYYAALDSMYEGVQPKLSMRDTSLEGTGKRTVDLEFYGHKCTFDVNVIENPVESVSAITTKPIIDGWRQYPSLVLDGGMILTVNYKDGTKVSGTPNEMLDMFYDYPQDYTYKTNVVIGKNTTEVEFLGKTFDVEYEVIEDPNPVVSLDAKVKEGAVIYEKTTTTGETWYSYDHIVDVTLTFKDGTKITGNVDEVNQQLEDINISTVFADPIRATEAGEYTVSIFYEEFEKEVTIEIVENPYSKATISNENGLTIVLERANGEKETYIAKRFSPAGSMGSNSNMFGYIVTDKETLPVEINFGGGRRADYSNVSNMYIHGIKSNELKACTWLEQQLLVEMYGNVPTTSVNHSTEELVALVLTEADYAQGRENEVTATLAISEKEAVSSADQQLLDKATETLGDYKEGIVVDLTLYKEYPNMQIGQDITEKVSEPNGKVSITMAVPEEILASGTNPENIKMVRIHNGETTVLPCTYDKVTQTITFETDAFSTYSMVYEVAQNGSNTTTNKTSPNTGDNNSLIGYMTLCVAALAVVVVERKRRFLTK